MPIFKNMVTCMYCEKLVFEYDEKDEFSLNCSGYCKMKRGEIRLSDGICVNFKIKSGYHTPKWYPNKK